jgi:hypothetical protein
VGPGGRGPTPVSPALAAFLAEQRSELNALFAQARHENRDLEPEAFSAFLAATVDPLVAAVHGLDRALVADVGRAAYEVGLELVGRRLAGPGARTPWLDAGLRRLLPPLARLASRAPARVLASLANALHQIGTTPGARVDAWVDALEALGPACPDADVLLRLGQVLAWRAGLAQYRSGALAVARALPEELARRALELPAGADVRGAIERLDSDPWFAPGAPAGLRSVARVGAFRGFGGAFVVPPLVRAQDERFLVRSGDECWSLIADRCGATLHRAPLEQFEKAPAKARLPDGTAVTARQVRRGDRTLAFDTGSVTSHAATATTLALTTSHSHAIELLALA